MERQYFTFVHSRTFTFLLELKNKNSLLLLRQQVSLAVKMRPPSEKNNVAAGDGEKYNVEFRSDDDDAWYSVRVVMESEEVMRIKFMHFGESHDKLFDARSFASLDAVNQFKKRFRPVSLQLQDNECRRVVDHETVCACFQHNAEDVRFYDANVIGVSFTLLLSFPSFSLLNKCFYI